MDGKEARDYKEGWMGTRRQDQVKEGRMDVEFGRVNREGDKERIGMVQVVDGIRESVIET